MSFAIIYFCLALSTLVSQLWAAVSASALQSFVSQLWTSQALVAECSDIEKHRLLGVYGGVMLFFMFNEWLDLAKAHSCLTQDVVKMTVV